MRVDHAKINVSYLSQLTVGSGRKEGRFATGIYRTGLEDFKVEKL